MKGELAKFFRDFLPQYVSNRLEDRFTHGVPDFPVTGGSKRVTVWLEVKHANPKFQCRGVQELMMLRLAKAGYAAFVVYYEDEGIRRTYIVDPKDIGKAPEEWTVFSEGFNHRFVAEYVVKVSNDH